MCGLAGGRRATSRIAMYIEMVCVCVCVCVCMCGVCGLWVWVGGRVYICVCVYMCVYCGCAHFGCTTCGTHCERTNRVCEGVHEYVCVCGHVKACAYMCMYISTFSHIHYAHIIQTPTHPHTHTHTHTHIHDAHTRTHTHTLPLFLFAVLLLAQYIPMYKQKPERSTPPTTSHHAEFSSPVRRMSASISRQCVIA
jgi:hypothetical protein